LIELEREAAQATRQTPAYTDLTVSFSKSISVFHASIRENERRARLAGNEAEAQWWADAEQRYQDVLQEANRAGLEYVQWAGITRTGYHGTRVGDQEPGRYEEAMLTVTSWLQGTSRDGDPQDHIHNQVARMVKTVSDGKWRALDTMSLRQVLGAVQAIVATHAECGLTREFGVEWIPRRDGIGNEIVGISQQQMDAYPSRTISISDKMPAAVVSWTAKYGREPNERELLYIRQAVTLSSRHGNEDRVIDWDALAERWDARIGGELASIAPRVSRLRAHAHAIPAGSGKTRALAEAARVCTSAGLGPVIGITTTQAARNVLAAAGVPMAENSSVFLGHLPGQRGALGVRDLSPGTLLLIDEASMMSMTDLFEIVQHAARSGASPAGPSPTATPCGSSQSATTRSSSAGRSTATRSPEPAAGPTAPSPTETSTTPTWPTP
jgi:hypothetical protein